MKVLRNTAIVVFGIGLLPSRLSTRIHVRSSGEWDQRSRTALRAPPPLLLNPPPSSDRNSPL